MKNFLLPILLIILFAEPAWAVGATIAFYAFNLTVGTFAFYATAFVINFAVSTLVSRAFAKKPPSPVDNGVRQQVPPATVNSIPVVYGDAYLGGQFVDAVLSVDQKTMYYTLVISSVSPNGQFSIDQSKIYYGDRLITFDATDAAKVASLTDGAGNVDTKIDGNLYIWQFVSDENGNVSSLTTNASMPWDVMSSTNTNIPAGLSWPSTGRRMNGTAFAVVALLYSRDDDTTQLQPITFRCSHYLNSTGTARPGDVWYDYMTNVKYGAAMDAALVDSASAAALNTYSDQNITFTNNQGQPTVQPRYRVNGVLDTGDVVLANVEKILTACDSWMAYNAASGQWSIVINKAESTAMQFNDTNIIGDIRVSATDINQGLNQIEAKFPSKLNKDIPDYVFLETPSNLLYPNEPINKFSTSFDLVNDSVQAQYLANRILEQARLDLIVSIKTTYEGIQLNAGDVVSITNSAYGWTNKLFRVMKVNEASLPDGNLGASLELNEYNAQVYDDKPITEFDPNGESGLPSPNYFPSLPAPTFENITAAATIPEFTVRCTLPAVGRVVSVDLYYQVAPNSSSLSATGWVYFRSNQLPSGQAYPNTGYVDFVLTGIPASPIGQQYFAGYVVNNELSESLISLPSTGLVWSPNIIVPSSLGTNYEWSPANVPVPTDSTGTVITTGQQVSVYLRVGPSVIDAWDGTGTQPNNSWYVTSVTTTTGLTISNFLVDLSGDKFSGTVTGLTVREGYITITGSYKDSSGVVTAIGSSSVAVFQQRQGSNAPVLNAEWDPTNLFQRGPDGIWYPTPVANVITSQVNVNAEVNGTDIGRYAYVLSYNVNTRAWSSAFGTNPAGNLNIANFTLSNVATSDNGYTATVTYNDGTNIVVNNLTISAVESGVDALVLYKDWEPTNIFTQAANAGAWSPTPVSNVITTQCNLTAQRGGVDVGRTAVIAQYNITTLTWAFNLSGTHPDGNLNPERFTYVNTQNTTNGYVTTATYTDSLGVVTTAISISAIPSGANGNNGLRTATLEVYRWSSTVPTTFPSGTSTYTWATGTFTAPATLNGWSLTIPAPVTGQVLYGTQVVYTDTLTTATSSVSWNATVAYPVSYAGTNGTNGTDGTDGTDGTNGNNARVAYRVQSQSTAIPATPSATSGGTSFPTGWSGTFTQPAAGEVLYSIDGIYNPTTNLTTWSAPILTIGFAATVQSDNFSPGSAGWRIERNTGNAEFNDVTVRGTITGASDIIISGDGEFSGTNAATFGISIAGVNYNIDYSAIGLGFASQVGVVRAGFVGYSNVYTGNASWNVGLLGKAENASKGIGVVGEGALWGGFFTTSNQNGAGLFCQNTNANGIGLYIGQGKLQWGAVGIPQIPNDSNTFLRGDGTWASIGSIGGGTVTSVSGTGTVSGITLSGTVTTTGNLTLGGSLSLTTAQLTATSPGSGYVLASTGWFPSGGIMLSAVANSGSANVSSNVLNLLGSTSTGIAGAYVGTSASGNTVIFQVRTTSPSDVRLKHEIEDCDLGLEFVNKLRPVSYKLKHDPEQQKGYGFIADEVEQHVAPGSSLVYFEDNWEIDGEIGFKTIHYPSYIAVLTKSIQQLTKRIEELEAKISSTQN